MSRQLSRIAVLATLCAAPLFALTTASHADSLTTLFAGPNGAAGNMFDLTATQNLTINSFAINLTTGTIANVAVYFKAGTFVGFESAAASWTLVGTQNGVVSNGSDVPTPLDVPDFSLSAGQTYGLYVVTTDTTDINYTNGANVFNNANLSFSGGIGKTYGTNGFDGDTFSPRTWNGTVNYTLSAVAVPEASTFALALPALGMVGAVLIKRRKK